MWIKRLWITFWLLFFFIYIPFTRVPSLFNSEKTKGYVTDTEIHQFKAGTKSQTHENPVVKYYVDSVEYFFIPASSANYLGIYSKGDEVTILYEEDNPKNATIRGIIGYLINYTEIATALLLLCILTLAFATVKNWNNYSQAGKDQN